MVWKTIKSAASEIVRGNIWKKFVNPTVGRGLTLWPKVSKDLERFGIRFDYDGEVEKDGEPYHKFQCQPNAGKIPTSLKKWREENGETHAVIGTLLVKKNGTAEDVKEGIENMIDEIE